MKTLAVNFLVALCLFGTGCRLTHNVLQTTIVEPLHYSKNAYEKLAHKRFTGLAEFALEQAIAIERAELDNYACEPYSIDYQYGFVDGFVDYLEAGGRSEPPLLPPRRYWKARYQSPEGHQFAEQWFEGYRHGASTAQQSNYRSLVTVPLSDTIVADTKPYPYGRIQMAEETPPPEVADPGDASPPQDNIVDAKMDGDAEFAPHAPRSQPAEHLSRLPSIR